MRKIKFEGLSQFARLIPQNLHSFTEAYPKIAIAAEAVHQGFQSLLFQYTKVDADNIQLGTIITMGFGAHSCWITAFILSGSGHIDSGWSDMRRAVEFGCYSTKVIKCKKRAEDWMKQRTDQKARSRFSSSCSLPLCYTSTDYKLLRPLLVAYETANYYGSHANLESLANKYHGTSDGIMSFSYQANEEAIPRVAGLIILLGFRLLQVFRDILHPYIEDVARLDSLLSYVNSTVREMRITIAENDYKGFIPDNVINTIFFDKQEEIDVMFEELIEKERQRKERAKETGVRKDIT